MNINDKMLRRTAAFIAALSFLSASGYNTAGVIAAELSANQQKVSDTENAEKKAKDGVITISVDYKNIIHELVDFMNGMENKPSDCRITEDDGSIKVEYSDLAKTTEFLSGVELVKIIGSVYFLYTIDTENSDVLMHKYYRFEFNENSPILSINIDEDCIRRTDDGNEYIRQGTELTEDSFTLRDGYYVDCTNYADKEYVNSPLIISTETVTSIPSNNGADFKSILFIIKKQTFTVRFMFTDDIVINLYNHNKPATRVQSSAVLNWADVDLDRIDFNNFGNGMLVNDEPFMVDGKFVSWYYQGSVREFLEAVGVDIDYATDRVIDIYLAGVPEAVNSRVTYIKGDESIEAPVRYEVGDSKVKIPYIVRKDDDDYYLSQVNYSHGQQKDFTAAEVVGNLQNSLCNYEIDYFDGIYVSTAYTKIDESENKVDKAEIISKAAETDSKRNDSTISISKDSPLTLGTDFEGRYFLVALDDEMRLCEVKDGQLELGSIKGGEVFEVRGLFDTAHGEDGSITSVSSSRLSEKLYIYIDNEQPYVSVDKNFVTMKYGEGGWSSERDEDGIGRFRFRFSMNDNVSELMNPEYHDIVNEDPDYDSITMIDIGGVKFHKPEGGWASASSIVSAESAVNSRGVIMPLRNQGVFEGEFDVVFMLRTGEVMGFDKNAFVSATDRNGNSTLIGKDNNLRIKIDTYNPKVKKIELDNLCKGFDGGAVVRYGSNLEIKISATDILRSNIPHSDIESVTVKYGDREKVLTDITQEENTISFDVSGITSCSGIITLELLDHAGNTSTFYYCSDDENGVTDDAEKATAIGVDNKIPSEPELTFSAENFTSDGFGFNKCCNDYPTYFIKTDAEIKTLSIIINGQEFNLNVYDELAGYGKDYISGMLTSGRMYIEFVTAESDSRLFIPHLRYEDIDIALCDEYIRLGQSRLSIIAGVMNYAENTNKEHTEKSADEVYIDNNAPEISGIYTVEESYRDGVKFRAFGNFANRQIVIHVPFNDGRSVSEYNGEGWLSSGIKRENAVLEFAGKNYTAESISGNEAVFVLPETDGTLLAEGELVFSLKDNVGNASEKITLAAENGIQGIMFENGKPLIENIEIVGEDLFINGAGEKWYSGDVSFSCDITDTDSGIAATSLRKYHSYDNSDFGLDHSYPDEKITADRYEATTDMFKDGRCVFSVDATDNAGNYEKQVFEVYKDTADPYISGFNFDWQTAAEQQKYESVNIVPNMSDRFSHFFESDTEMTVFAKDNRGASSGIKSITCVLYNTDGSVFRKYESEYISFDAYDSVYSCRFVIPEGFKGDIKAWASDNVNNVSEEKSPDGCISENDSRHLETSRAEIKLPKTDKSDGEKLPLYNSDVAADINIYDGCSGIKRVEWLTSDFEGWKVLEIDGDGFMSGDSDGWNIISTERNIVTSISKNITVSKDENGDFIRLRVYDNSGNYTETEKLFSIDKKTPTIRVEGVESAQGRKYYNYNRKATVSITEKNYAAPLINGSADTEFTSEGNDRYTKTFNYEKDGVYSLDIDCTDLAGNKADRFSSGEFVIDKTAPVLTVNFIKDDGSGVNPNTSHYIDLGVTVVINVKEANFDSSLILINGKAASGWKSVGDAHMLEIMCREDKEYKFTISGKDLADNPMTEYTASFVVDNSKPEIIANSFKEAHKGEVNISLNVKDSNIDKYEAVLKRNGKTCEVTYNEVNDVYNFRIAPNKFITGRWTTVDSGNIDFVFDDFPYDEAFDGIYTLRLDVSDKSINKQSIEKSFSVNRFGSAFTIQDYESINGNYLNYAPEIVIRERNIDKHKDGSKPVIVLNKGTQIIELTEDMYTMSKPEQLSDKSGYEYTYTISPSNFEENVRYQIAIKSVDKAGNENVSEKRGADIEFSVDTRKPEPSCDELEGDTDKTFKGAAKEFTINVNEPLRNIRVMIDSQAKPLLEQDFEYGSDEKMHRFIVNASDNKRNITVELTDLAGNKTTKEYRGVRVTENMLLIMLSKAWVRVAGAAAALAAAVIASAVIFIRKKRK